MTATATEIVSDYSFSLFCSAHSSSYVDTPIRILFVWYTPSGKYDRTQEVDGDTNVDVLTIHRAKIEDTGHFTCSATINDSSGSDFITGSRLNNDYVWITVSK